MRDCHIHIEKGDYTLDWISEFVRAAVVAGLEEIWLLEHSYRFREFVPMYGAVRTYSSYINDWLGRKAGARTLEEYLRLIDTVRNTRFPVTVRFGLEICYFKDQEETVYRLTKDAGLDFHVGSVHFIDGFAFDHKPEHWIGRDTDRLYRRYFETSLDLAGSGIYSGLAHPDCIKLFGHKPSFPLDPYYDALAAALAKAGMYAEQNSGAHRRCPDTAELGMSAGLLRAMKKHNATILTASDAHRPGDVGYKIAELQKIWEAVP